jgi:ribosomal protein L31
VFPRQPCLQSQQGWVGEVSSLSRVLILPTLTTNDNDAVFEANLDVSRKKHPAWSSKATRSAEGLSG